jgi:hypothetical protein
MGSKRFEFKIMRDLLLILAITGAASFCDGQPTHNAVLSRDWDEGKLTLKLDEGIAELGRRSRSATDGT